MRSWMRRLSLCALAALFLAGRCSASDVASAREALKKGNYATAFKTLAPLAKQGKPEAQVLLGRMYLMGYGVLKDPAEAYELFNAAAAKGNADGEFYIGARAVLTHVGLATGLKYLRLSAEQGNQDAQLLLGQTYSTGIKGAVPRDPVKAEMWLRLAAKNNLPFYKAQLEGAERQMTPEQVAQGKALAAAWKPQHGLRPDTKPRSTRP